MGDTHVKDDSLASLVNSFDADLTELLNQSEIMSYDNISSSKLRNWTRLYLGENIGPVTPKTKKIYLNKLRSALRTKLGAKKDQDSIPSVKKTLVFENDEHSDENKLKQDIKYQINEEKTHDLNSKIAPSFSTLYVVSSDSSKSACIETLLNKNPAKTSSIFYSIKDASAFLKQKSNCRLFLINESELIEKSPNSSENEYFIDSTNYNKKTNSKLSKKNELSKNFFQEFTCGLNIENQFAVKINRNALQPMNDYQMTSFGKQIFDLKYAIQSHDVFTFKSMIINNPRLLINPYSDIPNILHEGFRLNALHLATRANNVKICSTILDFVHNKDFLLGLYSNISRNCKFDQLRDRLIDFFLNMGEGGMNDSPLHIACKNASVDIIKLFVSYPQTKVDKKNKLGLMPSQVIGMNNEGMNKLLDHEVRIALEGQVVINLVQKEECDQPKLIISPLKAELKEGMVNNDYENPINDSIYFGGSTNQSKTSNNSSKSPFKRAQLGPLSPSLAKEIKKIWVRSRATKSNKILDDLLRHKSNDLTKGFESVGRYLAHENKFDWIEYWPMLGMEIDIASEEGIKQLDNFFMKKIAQNIVNDFMLNIQNLVKHIENKDMIINRHPSIKMNLIGSIFHSHTQLSSDSNNIDIDSEFPSLNDNKIRNSINGSCEDDDHDHSNNYRSPDKFLNMMSPMMSSMNSIYEELLQTTKVKNNKKYKQTQQLLDVSLNNSMNDFNDNELDLYGEPCLVSLIHHLIMKKRQELISDIKTIISMISSMVNVVMNDILFDIKITHISYSSRDLVSSKKCQLSSHSNNNNNNGDQKPIMSLITNSNNLASSIIIIIEPYKYEMIGSQLNVEEHLSSGISLSPSQFGFNTYETDVCSIVFQLPCFIPKNYYINGNEHSKDDLDVMKALQHVDLANFNQFPFFNNWYCRNLDFL